MSTTGRVRSSGHLLGGIALICVLASCSTAPGNGETDRVARAVADAIGLPQQDSAEGFVRAALATNAGQDSRLIVIEVEELQADTLVDPLARLVFQVHLEASGNGLNTTDPVTACYEARFSFYGVVGSPHRITCPAGDTAIVPAPQAHAVIPEGFDSTLEELLAALPAAPSTEDVIAIVTGAMPAPTVDPSTGLPDLSPAAETAVNGADIGVSLWAPFERHCLLGARIGGQVTVWWPSLPQPQLGNELPPCEPQTALQLLGTVQPQ